MDMAIPADLETFTEDIEVIAERDKSMWWKIKAIASQTTFRLFHKYGTIKYVKHIPEEKAFNQKFQDNFGEMLLESHL